MQEPTNKPPKRSMQDLKKTIGHLLRLRSKTARPEDIEPFLTDLSKSGADENVTSSFREAFTYTIAAMRDDARFARTDKILLGGLIAMDFIIFQAVLSFNPIDTASVVALITLGISILTAGGFLFIRFTQEDRGIQGYDWKIISRISFVSLLGAWIGIPAAIWHASPLAAIIFFVVTLIMGIFCAVYYTSVALRAEAQKRYEAARDNHEGETS